MNLTIRRNGDKVWAGIQSAQTAVIRYCNLCGFFTSTVFLIVGGSAANKILVRGICPLSVCSFELLLALSKRVYINQTEDVNMSNQLTFNNIALNTINRDGQIWITSADLAKALDYKSQDSVTRIYNRYSDEFSSSMSLTVNLTVNGINNSLREKATRIFSLRGCHLIAMFAKTKVAKEFRKWVLDILDHFSKPQIEEQPKTKSNLANAPENLDNSRAFALALIKNGALKFDEVSNSYDVLLKNLNAVTDNLNGAIVQLNQVKRMIADIDHGDGAIYDALNESQIYLFLGDEIRKNAIEKAKSLFKPLDLKNI